MEASTNDMEVNLPLNVQVAPTIRASQPNPNEGRTPRSREKHREAPHSSQPRIRHFSPQTPGRPSRGRGNYRGKRGNRGNFRGNTQYSNTRRHREYENQSYGDYENQSHHRSPTRHVMTPIMERVHTIVIPPPRYLLIIDTHHSEIHITPVIGEIIMVNLHMRITPMPMKIRVFARTKNEVQTQERVSRG